MNLTVRPETASDFAAIRQVNRLAFGRNAEAELVHALREGGYARSSLVAEIAGEIVGHIFFSTLAIETESVVVEGAPAPLAVIPSRQRQGIGSTLVREGLRGCAAAGNRIVVVLGHPEFYPRFGFSAKLAERLKAPFAGEAFMAWELWPGSLDRIQGEVRYPPPFGAV